MKENFDKAFNLVVAAEGGYNNDPNDAGGETKFGISKRAYPELDIKNLTIDDAKDIYLKDYWNNCRCDELSYPVDVLVFDCSVNKGCKKSIEILQRAIGNVAVDGILGSGTIKAIDKCTDLDIKFCTQNQIHYFGCRSFDKYGAGWLNRVNKLLRNLSC